MRVQSAKIEFKKHQSEIMAEKRKIIDFSLSKIRGEFVIYKEET